MLRPVGRAFRMVVTGVGCHPSLFVEVARERRGRGRVALFGAVFGRGTPRGNYFDCESRPGYRDLIPAHARLPSRTSARWNSDPWGRQIRNLLIPALRSGGCEAAPNSEPTRPKLVSGASRADRHSAPYAYLRNALDCESAAGLSADRRPNRLRTQGASGSVFGSDAISMTVCGFTQRRAIWLEEGRVSRARTSGV
jgi:hypothetical protein